MTTKESRHKPGHNRDGEDFDKTQLKMGHFRYTPHKDYLGHIFRWGFVSRHVKKGMRVLDVGCGQEMPMCRALAGSKNTVPSLYLGVDLNKIREPYERPWSEVRDSFNFCANAKKLAKEYEPGFDVVVNLEVFEHMTMPLGRKLLRGMKACMSENGRLIFSTPVYSERFKMARNHINELTKAEMERELQRAGFKIVGQYGTFGNYHDYKKRIPKAELPGYERLREFYGDDILGCYLAPRFPESSRNVTHICVHEENSGVEACELVESLVK